MTSDLPEPVERSASHEHDAKTQQSHHHHDDDHHHQQVDQLAVSPARNAEKNKVFIGNLDYSITDVDLKAYVEQVGEVLELFIVRHNGQSQGFGFITYATEEAAAECISVFNKTECGGRILKVESITTKEERAQQKSRLSGRYRGRGRFFNRRPRPSNRPENGEYRPTASTDPVTLTEQPSEADQKATTEVQTGDKSSHVEEGNVVEDVENKTVESAKIESEQTGADPVRRRNPREKNASTFDGEEVKRKSRPSRPRGPPSDTTLHVGNLPFSMNDEQLCELFRDFKVDSAQVVKRDGKKRNLGFGFVNLIDHEEQTRAMKELKRGNAVKADGRTLVVRVARTRVKDAHEDQAGIADLALEAAKATAEEIVKNGGESTPKAAVVDAQ